MADEPRPNLSPTIIDGNDAQLPDPYGKPAGTIYYARDTGITRILDINNAGVYSWKVVALGPIPPGAVDFPFVYVVDSEAVGGGMPFITPILGRGPFPTIEAAIAQVTTDRLTFGATYPAIVMLNRGTYAPAGGTLSVPVNVALVSLTQQADDIVQIIGNVTLAPAAAGAFTLSGLHISGQLALGTAFVVDVRLSHCQINSGALIGALLTNTGVGSTFLATDTTIAVGAAVSAISTSMHVSLIGSDLVGGIVQTGAVVGLLLTMLRTSQVAASAGQIALDLINGAIVTLTDVRVGYRFDQFAINAPPAGAKPTVTDAGAVTFYPLGGTPAAGAGPYEMTRLLWIVLPQRRGLNQTNLTPVGGGVPVTQEIPSNIEYARVIPTSSAPNARVNLPLAANLAQGTELIIKNAGLVGLDVFAQAGETVEGAAFLTLGSGASARLLAQPQIPTWDQAP